jgi:hypothetical protein
MLEAAIPTTELSKAALGTSIPQLMDKTIPPSSTTSLLAAQAALPTTTAAEAKSAA